MWTEAMCAAPVGVRRQLAPRRRAVRLVDSEKEMKDVSDQSSGRTAVRSSDSSLGGK